MFPSEYERVPLSLDKMSFIFEKDSVASKINAIEQINLQQQHSPQSPQQQPQSPLQKQPSPQPPHQQERVEFCWKYGGRHVIITGDFDNWSQSLQMSPCPEAGQGVWKLKIKLDKRNKKVLFKFVVDGVWRCSLDHLTQTDKDGNVNNFLEF